MADIIDFRAKTKPYRKNIRAKTIDENFGEIILFSGVRFQHDDVEDSDYAAVKNQPKPTKKYLETTSR